MKTILITGTDTEVGKTVLITALVAYFLTYNPSKSLGLMKLLQTGRGDQERYQHLFGSNSALDIRLGDYLALPVAPPIAAQQEGKNIDLGKIWRELSILQKQQDCLLLEALGGLGSPVTAELTVADLAGEWRLDTLLVVPVKLGAIAQAVANVALARQCKVKLRGIIFNCYQEISEEQLNNWAPVRLIESLTQIPVLGVLPYLEDVDDLDKLTQVASNFDLEMIKDVFSG
jgi:dethiobiotin synthetase